MKRSARHYWQVPSTSANFASYNLIFLQKLVRLYMIKHPKTTTQQLVTGEWKGEFYHGTGNCVCLETREKSDRTEYCKDVPASAWCWKRRCPVRGILQQGFRKEFSFYSGRHFFSRHVDVVQRFSRSKCRTRRLHAVFVCKARDVHTSSENKRIRYVHADENIHPVFLAIVRN